MISLMTTWPAGSGTLPVYTTVRLRESSRIPLPSFALTTSRCRRTRGMRRLQLVAFSQVMGYSAPLTRISLS